MDGSLPTIFSEPTPRPAFPHSQRALDPSSVGLLQHLGESFRLQHVSSAGRGQRLCKYYVCNVTWFVWPRATYSYSGIPVVQVQWMLVGMEAVLASTKVQSQSTEVKKDVELQYDLGNLLASDLNALDSQSLRCVVNEVQYKLMSTYTQRGM